MKIIKNTNELNLSIKGLKNLSFVPTMGSLHAGHKSLIKIAKKKSKKVLVSIFINPKQFNSKKDFISYPKNLSKDLRLLKKLKVNFVFIPTYNEIYSFSPKKKIFLHAFSKKLCGKYRPGHFKGVINVVNRFLSLIKPKYIMLGKKDRQQLFLIQKHISKRKINSTVVACNTIRNKSGLPISSRNKNLTSKEILLASKVIKLIKKEKNKPKKKKKNIVNLRNIRNKILKIGIKKIEYIESLNTEDLSKLKDPKKKFNIFIAFYVNKTRLIDNI